MVTAEYVKGAKMSVYLIAFPKVTDLQRFGEYIKAVADVVAKYDGKYLVRGGEIKMLEGIAPPERAVVIEFPDMQRGEAFYNSPEYREVKKLREGAATATLVLVEGC